MFRFTKHYPRVRSSPLRFWQVPIYTNVQLWTMLCAPRPLRIIIYMQKLKISQYSQCRWFINYGLICRWSHVLSIIKYSIYSTVSISTTLINVAVNCSFKVTNIDLGVFQFFLLKHHNSQRNTSHIFTQTLRTYTILMEAALKGSTFPWPLVAYMLPLGSNR